MRYTVHFVCRVRGRAPCAARERAISCTRRCGHCPRRRVVPHASLAWRNTPSPLRGRVAAQSTMCCTMLPATPLLHTAAPHRCCTPLLHTAAAHRCCTPLLHTMHTTAAHHAHRCCTPRAMPCTRRRCCASSGRWRATSRRAACGRSAGRRGATSSVAQYCRSWHFFAFWDLFAVVAACALQSRREGLTA